MKKTYNITLETLPRSNNYYNSNHWSKRHKDKKTIMDEFHWLALKERLPIFNKIKVIYQFYTPSKSRPFKDIDNSTAGVKMINDAIKEFMEGDDTSENLRFEILPFKVDKNYPRIEVTIERNI